MMQNGGKWNTSKEKHEELVLELARISSPHYLYIKNIFMPNYFRDDE
jgi:hypothetical protein